jgi:hypothetical protein
MKLRFQFAAVLALALLPAAGYAQNFTAVSATIVDPNGIPYSNATIQAQLVPTGTTPTLNGVQVASFSSASANTAGTFSMTLASNAALSPGGTQWQFTVNETGVPPPFGKGPQSFVATITISGASQSISTTLNAAATALTQPISGSGSGTVNTGTQYAFAEYATSTNAVSSGPTPPSVNGSYSCGYTVTASAAVAPTCPEVGLAGRAVTGTTATDTLLYSDNNNMVKYEGSVAVAVTLPTPTSLTNSNWFTVLDNLTTGSSTAVTVTPTTLTINSGASLTIQQGQECSIVTDPASPTTNWVSSCKESGIVVTSPVTAARAAQSITLACATCTTNASALTNNVLVKGAGGQATQTSSVTDNGTTVTTTDTGGYVAPVFQSNGSTAGFVDYPQGSTSAAVSPCNTATSICEQAPAAVTSYLVTKPGSGATGMLQGNISSGVITQSFSGDGNHSLVQTTGSGTSITSTQICTSANCPAGTYQINSYLDITTPCGTSGTYSVSLLWTDDTGSSKTWVIPMEGPGEAAGVLTTTATTNFGSKTFTIRSNGAASINFLTTAVACGTAGPMVGKLYIAIAAAQ